MVAATATGPRQHQPKQIIFKKHERPPIKEAVLLGEICPISMSVHTHEIKRQLAVWPEHQVILPRRAIFRFAANMNQNAAIKTS